MMDKRSQVAVLSAAFFIGVCMLAACGTHDGDALQQDTGMVSVSDFDGSVNVSDSVLNRLLDSMDTRAYVMPTPTQVATVLSLYHFPFNSELVTSLKNEETYSTAYQRALNLGRCSIDLSYLSINGYSEEAVPYLKQLEILMHELDIQLPVTPSMSERFKEHLNERDSLSHIILEAYKLGHDQFKTNGREGLGLLIATGCYIEGLHILLHVDRTHNPEQYEQLLAQQKLALKAIVELMAFYSNNERIRVLLNQLEVLQSAFDIVKISYISNVNGVQRMAGSVNDDEEKLIIATESIRASMFNAN